MKQDNRPLCILLLILALVINFLGINLDFFSNDPGLYASISKNLIYRKEFFELFTYNRDWLDKPHFPFWMIWASFKIFGISVWAYRLPALLFFLQGLRYTYLFTKKYYGEEIAWIAVLIASTALNTIICNTDVRAEPYLMALIVGSIFHIDRLEERFNFKDLLLGALLTACAIMTKGIFVIAAIYGALLGQLVFQRKFSHLFRWKWVLLALLTCIFVLPEIYALYIQFDAHPEKVVFNRHNVSGIRWFLWDSQFGRFVNSGPITRQSGDIFFYVHTLLWAFAPWCLLFYYAIYKQLKDITFRKRLTEYYSLSGGLILLLLFSLSRFQLPYYTNAVFPLFAIITAPFCYNQLSKAGTTVHQFGLWAYTILLPLLILVIHYFSEPDNMTWFLVDCVIFAAVFTIIIKVVRIPQTRLFLFACASVLFAGFYLNTTFFKEVISYNGQIKAAAFVNEHENGQYHLYSLRPENDVFQFHANRPVEYVPLDNFNTFTPQEPSAFYANHRTYDSLKMLHANFKVLKAFENYPQENVLPAFINRSTRHKVLDSVYLITK